MFKNIQFVCNAITSLDIIFNVEKMLYSNRFTMGLNHNVVSTAINIGNLKNRAYKVTL